MDAPEILSRLEGVRKTASGWQARCPAHDDDKASLSVSFGDDGRVLVHCHAGCAVSNVLRNAGTTLAAIMPQNGAARRIVATYDYTDDEGEVLYQAVRYSPKDFRQRRPDGNGGYVWKLGNVSRVPCFKRSRAFKSESMVQWPND